MKNLFMRLLWGVTGFLTMILSGVLLVPIAFIMFFLFLGLGVWSILISFYAAYIGFKYQDFERIKSVLIQG